MSPSPARIVVMGAGLIGRAHIARVMASTEAELVGIVDPAPAARDLAAECGAAWAASLDALPSDAAPHGVIVATPNTLHVENGLACIAAGLPALIEKPIASDVASASRLVEAAEAAGVPLLVGHHRRYNPLVRAAKDALEAGRIGQVLVAHSMCWFFKPDDYFEVDWRRQLGAGPVLINLIHDIDLTRHFCGEVVEVHASEAAIVRGHPVEESAAIVLRFASGAVGTVTVSDAVVSPWSWELTAAENKVYHPSGQDCYLIGGTHGSLAIPSLTLWQNPGARSWWEPVEPERLAFADADPLDVQVAHFCAVIRGDEVPYVTGREGLKTLQVIEAVKKAAKTGSAVKL